MAFRTYKTLGEVLKKYQINYQQKPFLLPPGGRAAPTILAEELDFAHHHIPYRMSEEAICENITYPILREVWKAFIGTFLIWVQPNVNLDDELSNAPNYMITKRSAPGVIMFDPPMLVVAEVVRGCLNNAWPQCCLEMYAMQHLNQDTHPVYGIVSNGDNWEIAMLENSIFTKYSTQFTLDRLDELFAALTHVLESCKRIYSL